MQAIIKRYFSKLILVLRSHGLACMFALIVGAVSVAPHLLAQQALGASYQGFPYLFQANEDYYLTRVQEIIDGHWLVSSPHLYEYKDSLTMIFPTGEYLLALPALLFKVSAPTVLMAAKFVFPALLFLLVYILLFKLSRQARSDKFTALFGGLLVTLGEYFVNYKDTWQVLIGQNSDRYLSLWTRPVNPITGALFLIIFLILLWQSFLSKKWYWSAAAGIVLGLMTGYIFSWLMALALVGALVIISLVRRRFQPIKKMFLVILVSLLAGLPSYYLWLHPFFTDLGDGQQAAARNGMMLTHYPTLNKMVLAQTIFFLIVFLFEWRRKKKIGEKVEDWWWFTAALVIGNWLVYNQQIITGWVVWPPHLAQYTTVTAYLTFVLVLGNYFKARTPKLWSATIAAGVCAIVLFFAMTLPNYRTGLGDFASLQSLMPFFNWLNNQAPKDCVVLSKETGNVEVLSRWIPAFTHCNSYLTSYHPSLAPMERVYFNYLVDLRLRGVERKDLEQYFWNHKSDLRGNFFNSWSQIFGPFNQDDGWLAGPIKELVERYDALFKGDFATALKRYRLDYLASQEPMSASLAELFPRARLMGKFGSVYVYQL